MRLQNCESYKNWRIASFNESKIMLAYHHCKTREEIIAVLFIKEKKKRSKIEYAE